MTSTAFTIFAYVIGLALLWGYAASIWIAGRNARVQRIEIEEKRSEP